MEPEQSHEDGTEGGSEMNGKTHTIRGECLWHTGVSVAVEGPERLLLNNMDFEKNWRVKSWKVWPSGPNSVSHNLYDNDTTTVVLATTELGATQGVNLPGRVAGSTVKDNRQIGWATWSNVVELEEILSPGHIIVNDLWVNAWTEDSSSGAFALPNQPLAFMIELEQIKTSFDTALMALIKERAQDG